MYVAVNGSDATNDGTVGSPFATLGRAFDSCPPGGTIAVRGGIYLDNHLTDDQKSGKAVHIVNYPGEAVIFDGQNQASTVFVFGAGTDGSTFRGIGVRNYNTSFLNGISGALVFLRGGTVEYCHFNNNRVNGMSFQLGPAGIAPWNSVFRQNTCGYNGSCGMTYNGNLAVTTGHLLCERNHFHHNNQDPTLPDYSAIVAGIKVLRLNHGDIVENVFESNLLRGIWIDVQCSDILIRRNLCVGNGRYGIFYEVSGEGYIVDNVCADNAGTGEINSTGIQVQSSHEVYVLHNASARNNYCVRVVDADRTDPDAGPHEHPLNSRIWNNTMLDGRQYSERAMFWFYNPDHDANASAYGLQLQGNLYWRSNEVADPSPKFVSRLDIVPSGSDLNQTFAQHQQSGWDLDGGYATGPTNPFVRDEAAHDFRLPVGHPFENAGVELPAVVAARLGVPQVRYSPGPLTATDLDTSQSTGTFLALPGTAGAFAQCPDAPPLRITDDIDIRIYGLVVNAFNTGVAQHLVGKRSASTGQRAYRVALASTLPRPNLFISTDGNAQLSSSSTTNLPYAAGAGFDMRVTRRRSDGERRFFHRAAGTGTWLELGTPAFLAAGAASFAGSWPVSIGALTTSGGQPFAGRVDRVEICAGIDGQVVAAPDFTVLAPGQRQFFDAQGNLWSLEGGASISS